MPRVLEIFLIIVTSPVVFLIVAVAGILVRLDSAGPAIFRQQRVGRHGKNFTLCKLRTMAADTGDLPSHEASTTSVTRIGAAMRRYKIDELPQLWNVLTGDMSLVGPRPCLPTQKTLIDARKERGVLAVRPGVTGLSQIRGVDMSTPVELAICDAEYITRKSFRFDLSLILQTMVGRGGGDAVKF